MDPDTNHCKKAYDAKKCRKTKQGIPVDTMQKRNKPRNINNIKKYQYGTVPMQYKNIYWKRTILRRKKYLYSIYYTRDALDTIFSGYPANHKAGSDNSDSDTGTR